MIPGAKPRLGDELVKQGVLTPEQLASALGEQRRSSRKLGELLIEQGVLTPSSLVHTLARCLGVPGCHLRHGLIDPQLLKLIGPEEAERLCALPMFKVRGVLTVAMSEPQSLPAIDRLRTMIRRTIEIMCDQLAEVALLLRIRGNTEAERTVLKRRRELDKTMGRLVEQAIAEGDLRDDLDPGLVSRLLFGMSNSVVEWYRPGGSVKPHQIVDSISTIVFEGLYARREPGGTP